jgi:hypothetical protein
VRDWELSWESVHVPYNKCPKGVSRDTWTEGRCRELTCGPIQIPTRQTRTLAIPVGSCLIRQSYVMVTCSDNAGRLGKCTDAGGARDHIKAKKRERRGLMWYNFSYAAEGEGSSDKYLFRNRNRGSSSKHDIKSDAPSSPISQKSPQGCSRKSHVPT